MGSSVGMAPSNSLLAAHCGVGAHGFFHWWDWGRKPTDGHPFGRCELLQSQASQTNHWMTSTWAIV